MNPAFSITNEMTHVLTKIERARGFLDAATLSQEWIQRMANGMDLTGWLDYFTTGLATQMDEIKERGTKVIKANLIAREYGLNKRQQELLIYCMEVEQSTIKGMGKAFPDFTRRTLQRDLNKLVEIGILLIVGHTNDRYYTLPDNAL